MLGRIFKKIVPQKGEIISSRLSAVPYLTSNNHYKISKRTKMFLSNLITFQSKIQEYLEKYKILSFLKGKINNVYHPQRVPDVQRSRKTRYIMNK